MLRQEKDEDAQRTPGHPCLAEASLGFIYAIIIGNVTSTRPLLSWAPFLTYRRGLTRADVVKVKVPWVSVLAKPGRVTQVQCILSWAGESNASEAPPVALRISELDD